MHFEFNECLIGIKSLVKRNAEEKDTKTQNKDKIKKNTKPSAKDISRRKGGEVQTQKPQSKIKNYKQKGSKKTSKKKNTKAASSVRQSACSEVTCLTAIVAVMKNEKDLVRNFLAQAWRLKSMVALMGEN